MFKTSLLGLATVALSATIATDATAHAGEDFFNRKNAKHTKVRKKATSRISAIVSRPGNSADYMWSSAGNSWSLVSNTTYAYNNQAQEIMVTMTDPATSQPTTRRVTTYDNHNNLIERKEESWQSNTWTTVDGEQILYTYDAAGNPLTQIYKYYDPNSGTWQDAYKTTSDYNSNGQLISETNEEWDPMSNSWVPADKSLFTYTNNQVSQILIQSHDGISWEDEARITNLVWRTHIVEPQSYTLQVPVASSWMDMIRYNAVYDPNGGFVATVQMFNLVGWANFNRATLMRDSHSNIIGYREEMWNNNQWEINMEEKALLTYNANDELTEQITQNLDINTATFENIERKVFSNFSTFNVSGVSGEAAVMAATIFPNPAHDNINIQLPEEVSGVTARLTDLSGKTVLVHKATHAGTNFSLNLSELPAGMYILQLEAGKTVRVEKILKH